MVDRARENEKVEFVLNADVDEVLGEGNGHVTGLRLRDTTTGELSEIEADGLFVAVGHDPTTALFLDWLDHDDAGYLVTEPRSTRTNIPGVFAAGTSRITRIARLSRQPARARWPRSTRSAGWRSSATAEVAAATA